MSGLEGSGARGGDRGVSGMLVASGFPVLGRVSENRVRGQARNSLSVSQLLGAFATRVMWHFAGGDPPCGVTSLRPSRPRPVLLALWATQSAPGVVFHFGMCPHTLSVPSAFPPVSTLPCCGPLASSDVTCLEAPALSSPETAVTVTAVGRGVPGSPCGVTCLVSPVLSWGDSPCRGAPSCLR